MREVEGKRQVFMLVGEINDNYTNNILTIIIRIMNV